MCAVCIAALSQVAKIKNCKKSTFAKLSMQKFQLVWLYEIASEFTAIIIIHNASEYIHTPTVGDNVAIFVMQHSTWI